MADGKLARALSTRIRRSMLQLLCKKRRMSVHEIADKLSITESSASKHLKLLFDLGIIVNDRQPPETYYSLKIKEIKELFKIYNKILKKL